MESSRFYGLPVEVLIQLLSHDLGEGVKGDPILNTVLYSQDYGHARVLEWCSWAGRDYQSPELPDLSQHFTRSGIAGPCDGHRTLEWPVELYWRLHGWWQQPYQQTSSPGWLEQGKRRNGGTLNWSYAWSKIAGNIARIRQRFNSSTEPMTPEDYGFLFKYECDVFFSPSNKELIIEQWLHWLIVDKQRPAYIGTIGNVLLGVGNTLMVDIFFELIAAVNQRYTFTPVRSDPFYHANNFYEAIFCHLESYLKGAVGATINIGSPVLIYSKPLATMSKQERQARPGAPLIGECVFYHFPDGHFHESQITRFYDVCNHHRVQIPPDHWATTIGSPSPPGQLTAGPIPLPPAIRYSCGAAGARALYFYYHQLVVVHRATIFNPYLLELSIMINVQADRPDLLQDELLRAKSDHIREAAIMSDSINTYRRLIELEGIRCHHHDIDRIAQYKARTCQDFFLSLVEPKLLNRIVFGDCTNQSQYNQTLTVANEFYGTLVSRRSSNFVLPAREAIMATLSNWLAYRVTPNSAARSMSVTSLLPEDKYLLAELAIHSVVNYNNPYAYELLTLLNGDVQISRGYEPGVLSARPTGLTTTVTTAAVSLAPSDYVPVLNPFNRFLNFILSPLLVPSTSPIISLPPLPGNHLFHLNHINTNSSLVNHRITFRHNLNTGIVESLAPTRRHVHFPESIQSDHDSDSDEQLLDQTMLYVDSYRWTENNKILYHLSKSNDTCVIILRPSLLRRLLRVTHHILAGHYSTCCLNEEAMATHRADGQAWKPNEEFVFTNYHSLPVTLIIEPLTVYRLCLPLTGRSHYLTSGQNYQRAGLEISVLDLLDIEFIK